MKKINKTKVITLIAIMTLVFTSVGLSLAYFSASMNVKGEATVNLKAETVIEENVDPDGTKHIILENVGETDVVARVAVYGPWLTTDDMKADISFKTDGDWEFRDADGICYYTKVLAPGEKTSEIVVGLDKIPEGLANFDITANFNAALATYEDGMVAAPEGWDYIPSISE